VIGGWGWRPVVGRGGAQCEIDAELFMAASWTSWASVSFTVVHGEVSSMGQAHSLKNLQQGDMVSGTVYSQWRT